MLSDMRLYLDSNIIVAYYLEDDNAEQHNKIINCLNKISAKSNFLLIASSWTLIEADNALIRNIREKVQKGVLANKKADFKIKKAKNFVARLLENPKLGNLKFEIKEFSRNTEDVDFLHVEDFFDLVDELATLGNIRDVLHCVIMNHFGIKRILTFNTDDFNYFGEVIGDIETIDPDKIDNYIESD